MPSTLITNGLIITATDQRQADILLSGETIAAIGTGLDARAEHIIDADGLLILPGGVDNHTHLASGSGEMMTRGFETTPAALVGGTTTVVDFAPQFGGLGIAESVEKHDEDHARGKSSVDYAFHGTAMYVDDRMLEEIPTLPGVGVSTVKLFMAYKGTPLMVDDGALYRTLRASRGQGVLVMVHAENGDLIDALQKECLREGHVDPQYHAASRPPMVETEATSRAIAIARLAGAPLLVVHVSCRGAAEAIRDARAGGCAVYGETCPHYLVLDDSNLSKPGFEGARYVCSPALRPADHHRELWQALRGGHLQVVGSDHCGYDWKVQKAMGRGDFTLIPNGVPGIQFRLPILWTYGVEAREIDPQTMVNVFATEPARLNGLYPQKGHIAPGSDADLVLFDPRPRSVMTVEDSLEGVDYCLYEGMEQRGRVDKVFLRGRLVVEDGRFTGQPGQGQRLVSEPVQGLRAGCVGVDDGCGGGTGRPS